MDELDPKFCLVPFTSFSISPRGIIRTCCVQYEKNMHTEWENIKDPGDKVSLPTPRLIEMQEIMRGNNIEEKTPTCSLCWGSEKIGLPSYRTNYNNFMIKTLGIDKVKQLKDTPHINTLDLQFGHLCNNSCVMCNTSLSSHLYTTKVRLTKMTNDPEQKKFYESDLKYIDNQNDWTQSDEYYNKLLDLCKSVDEIKISGGEPLFNPRFKDFLRYLVTKELPLKRIHLTTNGTIYDDEIIELLNKIKKIVHIKLSLESVGAMEEFIRWPTIWQEKEQNLKLFFVNINKAEEVYIEVSSCIQSLNLFSINEVIKFINGIKNRSGVTVRINRQPVMDTDIASLAHCDNDYLDYYLHHTDRSEQPADVVKQVKKAKTFVDKRTKKQVQYYLDLAKLQQKSLEELFPIYWHFHKKYI